MAEETTQITDTEPLESRTVFDRFEVKIGGLPFWIERGSVISSAPSNHRLARLSQLEELRGE